MSAPGREAGNLCRPFPLSPGKAIPLKTKNSVRRLPEKKRGNKAAAAAPTFPATTTAVIKGAMFLRTIGHNRKPDPRESRITHPGILMDACPAGRPRRLRVHREAMDSRTVSWYNHGWFQNRLRKRKHA